MIQYSRHDYIYLPFVYLLIVVVTLSLVFVSQSTESDENGIVVPQKQVERTNNFSFDKSVFNNLTVKAKSYVVYDIVSGTVIASKNQDEKLALASLSKVMTALSSLMHNNKAAQVTIEDKSIDGTYDLGLKRGQVWSLGELLKYTLVFSSNDGAYAIADTFGGRASFVEQMNSDIASFGIALTFTDPAGLDIGSNSGGKGSALEMAKLFAITYKRYPYVFDPTTKMRANVVTSTGKLNGVPNTNQTISTIVEAEASKTGFTDNAGGNLAVIVDITLGKPVVIVVLGSTREERFSDVDVLYKALKKSIVYN